MIDETALRERARFLVALGKDGFDAAVRACTEIVEDDSPETTVLAQRLVTEELAAHSADQATWPDELDTDRLNRAFRELDTAGIVARLDHTCCQNCGISELGEEVADGDEPRGYAFAHRQDMERLLDGGALLLSYGVISEGRQPPEAQTALGHEVTDTLRRHDLEVEWDGTHSQRINVPVTWRRRRYGSRATWPGSPDPATPDVHLEVSFCDYARRDMQDAMIPLSLPESRDVLLRTTPYNGNFINFAAPSGKGMSVMWNAGPRLWLEYQDPANRRSHGRHVTVPEAEDLITILATEDRIALTGDLETIEWG